VQKENYKRRDTRTHTSIDMSPFNLVHLREPLWSDTLEKPVFDVPAAKEMADHCFAVFSRVRDCLEVSKLRTEKMLTVKRRRTDPMMEGDMVFLSTKNLRLKFAHVKLLPKFVGPFEIIKPSPNSNRNPNSVWLKTPKELKIHMPINIKDVRRYARPQHLGGVPSFDAPLPLVEDAYSKWEVETVLVTRVVKKTRRKETLILWQGFGIESASWEPIGNLAKLVFDEYQAMEGQAEALFEDLGSDVE